MKQLYLLLLTSLSFFSVQTMQADGIIENDTIKTYAIDEVMITSSTKETNNLVKLPGAVSLLSPQMITNRQIDALKDISAFVPNLYMPDYGSKLTSAIYIRGIGARSSGQSIGLYVDNVPYLDKSTFDFELTDIQRIEVLRGPQGTLYGRNAMGGIVHIYTLSPFDFQGTKISLSGGNYGQFKTKASHYNKLSENIAFSVGGYYDRNDGFFPNEFTGKKADKEESAGARLKLDWRITPKLTAAYTFTYDYTDQGAFPYGKRDSTGKVKPVNINDPSTYNRKMAGNHLLLTYRTEPFILTSTTGYQWLEDNMHMDQDYDTTSVFTLNQRQKQKAFSQEFAIRSNTNKDYQWSFGLFGFYNKLDTDGPVTFKKDGIGVLQEVFTQLKEDNPKMPTLMVLGDELYIPGTFETPSYGAALFHQSTINNLFTEGLSLTVGMRLDYEKQKMDYDAAARMRLGMSMRPGMPVTEIPTDTTRMDVSTSQDFWEFLPKVALKYECTPRTFTYLSVSKGYKTGGYNVQMSADLMQSQMQYELMNKYMPNMAVEPLPVEDVVAYKPEKSWNYELGIRSELIPDYLQAEATLFYMDIRDLQLTQFVNSGNGRILTNAGKARSYGAEVSLQARFTKELTADLNYGYTHATFRDYHNGREDFKGNHIPYTPQNTLNVGVQYNRLLQGSWLDQFTASVQYSGIGKIYWTEQNDLKQNFYNTVNAKIGVRKGIVNLNIWSKNITDTRYAAFYFESLDNKFMQLSKPFQIGAEVAITF